MAILLFCISPIPSKITDLFWWFCVISVWGVLGILSLYIFHKLAFLSMLLFFPVYQPCFSFYHWSKHIFWFRAYRVLTGRNCDHLSALQFSFGEGMACTPASGMLSEMWLNYGVCFFSSLHSLQPWFITFLMMYTSLQIAVLFLFWIKFSNLGFWISSFTFYQIISKRFWFHFRKLHVCHIKGLTIKI